MNDIASHLERLGLDHYLNAFVGEGFDTWDTLLDIQESDLESLNVKLGHRRKLQRAIAEYRGISYERLLGSPAGEGPSDPTRNSEGPQVQPTPKEGTTAAPTETKRKYRRHPKPDENAPDKPPSAYVLFSNKVREEVKHENLSFTEIAKLVGDRWQKLDAAQKEPFESQANALKEEHNVRAAAYKKTENYRKHCLYLEEFKAKHGVNTEAKRPKLDAQSSTGSASIASAASQEVSDLVATHKGVGSFESTNTTPYTGNIQSPPRVSLASVASLPNLGSPIHWPTSLAPRSGSPVVAQHAVDRRFVAPLSTQSSMSDEYAPSRSETYDLLPRAATLSLSTPPTGTPPLPTRMALPARLEHSTSSEGFTWSSRLPSNSQQYSTAVPSPHSVITLPSPTLTGEAWRERGTELPRVQPNPVFIPPSSYASTLPAPLMLGSERMPDLMRSSTQRTLPPLRPPPGSHVQYTHQGGLPVSGLFHYSGGTLNRQTSNGSPRPVNENEAANTLAGLANGRGTNPNQLTGRR